MQASPGAMTLKRLAPIRAGRKGLCGMIAGDDGDRRRAAACETG
jgi:hypothetical protein